MAPFSSCEDVLNISTHELNCNSFREAHFDDPLEQDLSGELENMPCQRVRFNSAQPKILNPETEYFTEEDCLKRWWTIEELKEIRQSAKDLCSRLRQTVESEDCALTLAHRKVTLMLASDFQSLLKLSPSLPDQDLSQWCSHDDGRRGLERFASKVYSSFRLRDIVKTRASVLTEQTRQRDQGSHEPELISARSQKASRRARSFAHFLAGADANQVLKRDAEPMRHAPPRKRSKLQQRPCCPAA